MCGIAGFFQGDIFETAHDVEDNLKRMTDAIRHRGPDSEGFWYDSHDKIALGHRRLAIQDLSSAGLQPMSSDDTRYRMIFNGEIYNHLHIRQEIEAVDSTVRWRGHSDTETILKSIELFGFETTLKKLIGMFAIALWDTQEKALYLARDRFGEKPLYYGWQHDTLLFGSELKALMPHQVFEKVIEKRAIPSLLRHGYIASPFCIWHNIFKLTPAHYLKFTPNDLNPREICYWSLTSIVEQSQQNRLAITDEQAINELEALLTESIKNQLISDVPLGALLSGGIDSSLVVALMQKVSQQPVKTFSIGFDDTAFDESKHAEAVARHLGTEHTTLIMTPDDLIKIVPEIANIYDEPFADSSQLPMTLVARLAKQHVTVALSGDAGDELFGGYQRYFVANKLWHIYGKLPNYLTQPILSSIDKVDIQTWDKMSRVLPKNKRVANLGDKLYKLAQRLQGVDSFEKLYRNVVGEKYYIDYLLNNNESFSYLLEDTVRWPSSDNTIETMMALDTLTYLNDDILVKIDRAAMSTSLELRAPFLSHPVFEYAWQLPFDKKVREGKGKWILRQILYRHVPQSLIDRPKQGFAIPLNQWLRGPLKSWAEALLFSESLHQHGIFNKNHLEQIWQAHMSGKRDLGNTLWNVIMFQAWYKVNVCDQ